MKIFLLTIHIAKIPAKINMRLLMLTPFDYHVNVEEKKKQRLKKKLFPEFCCLFYFSFIRFLFEKWEWIINDTGIDTVPQQQQ